MTHHKRRNHLSNHQTYPLLNSKSSTFSRCSLWVKAKVPLIAPFSLLSTLTPFTKTSMNKIYMITITLNNSRLVSI